MCVSDLCWASLGETRRGCGSLLRLISTFRSEWRGEHTFSLSVRAAKPSQSCRVRGVGGEGDVASRVGESGSGGRRRLR